MKAYTNTGAKLTRKQKAFADHLLANPKASATQAVQKAYDDTTYLAARAIGSENLTKPNIVAYLDDNAITASDTVLSVLKHSKQQMVTDERNGSTWANTALTASKDILDRVYGKATQRIEQTTTGVTLHIDLTSSLVDDTPTDTTI